MVWWTVQVKRSSGTTFDIGGTNVTSGCLIIKSEELQLPELSHGVLLMQTKHFR